MSMSKKNPSCQNPKNCPLFGSRCSKKGRLLLSRHWLSLKRQFKNESLTHRANPRNKKAGAHSRAVMGNKRGREELPMTRLENDQVSCQVLVDS